MRETSTETISRATAPRNFALSKRDSASFWPERPACGASAFTQPIPFLDMPTQHEPGSDDHARMSAGETAQHLCKTPTTSPINTRSKTMSKSAALNLALAAPTRACNTPSRMAAQLQARLKLPPGEAFDSLIAVHGILGAELPNRRLTVYEAGGGSTSFLPPDVVHRSDITVVDIDEEQLRKNDYADKTILGDIQTYRFAPETFDLVTCYNVLEHVPDVEAALTGFFESLKPGGMVLIAAPNPNSLSGVVTKYTPHWFHVWFYRHVRGDMDAGKPGQAPFPTVFHPLVSLSNLDAFAKMHGIEVIYRREYESPRFPEMRARKPVLAALIDAAASVINGLLLRTTDVRHGDYHVILRKR
jgi:SAM-dependent methyltransferase